MISKKLFFRPDSNTLRYWQSQYRSVQRENPFETPIKQHITKLHNVILLPCVFSDRDYLNKTRELIKINKNQLCEALRNIGCHIIDGNTNFVLVQLPFGIDSNEVTQFLMKNNMIVMNIKESYPELTRDWLRISINTRDNNELLVKKLKQSFNNFLK